MAHPYWPGGIPQTIRLHPDGELSREAIKDKTKGWLQFVQEECVPTSDSVDVLHQRRTLMEKWASADQDFRESYHLRASQPSSPLDYPASLRPDEYPILNRFVCLAPADKENYPSNYRHLIKILIMLYLQHEEGGPQEHPFESYGAGNAPNPQFPSFINPNFALEDLLSNLFLETADFNVISMTRTGTVIFANQYDPWFILDQTALDTLCLAVVDFLPNGKLKNLTRRRPFNLAHMIMFYEVKGWPLGDMLDINVGGPPWANQSLEMGLPIVDIMETVKQRSEFSFADYDGSQEMWTSRIQQFAPGYLELEARGQELDFDLASLQDISDR